MIEKFLSFVLLAGILSCTPAADKPAATTDSTTPLHMLQPDYPVPYGVMDETEIIGTLNRVLKYLEVASPVGLVDRNTGNEIPATAPADTAARLARGDFRLVSYEWGVLYAGMLLAGEVTGDEAFTDYTTRRMQFIADVIPVYRSLVEEGLTREYFFRSIVQPRALDDAGSMCAAMIKTIRSGSDANLRPMVDNYIDYISTGQYRLEDGTLARNRPLPGTLWLDDLFMSVPALAQMGKLTGENKYFDDAVKQVLQFSERMFIPEKELFIHGWVQGMEPHPRFHWARANGWALMAIVELLDVLPEDHPGHEDVLQILRAHVAGLAACQSGQGFWHQLLDRPDSYLETSATAIYTYSIARAINRGWIDPQAYGPMVNLAWNAVSTKINETGQVEGTCVGTGMGFDPAFYYYRPVNVYAAHGYGPVMLAGSEVLRMTRNFRINANDSAVQVYPKQ
jgi:unsaturated rhamnogalacturonyl hydrolase